VVVARIWSDYSRGAGVDQIVLLSTLDQAPKTEAVGLVGGNGVQFVAEILLEIANVGCCWAVTQIGDIAKQSKSIVVGDEHCRHPVGSPGANLNSFSKLVWVILVA